jgi:hypothetical protein
MFVKRASKLKLVENYEEAKYVEKEMLSLVGNHKVEENKFIGNKPLLLTKPMQKEPTNLESVLNILKKLPNGVFNLKKNVGDGSSHHKPFLTFHKKKTQPKPHESSKFNINQDEFL